MSDAPADEVRSIVCDFSLSCCSCYAAAVVLLLLRVEDGAVLLCGCSVLLSTALLCQRVCARMGMFLISTIHHMTHELHVLKTLLGLTDHTRNFQQTPAFFSTRCYRTPH